MEQSHHHHLALLAFSATLLVLLAIVFRIYDLREEAKEYFPSSEIVVAEEPIIVPEENFFTNLHATSSSASDTKATKDPDQITARAYLVGDAKTGDVYMSANADRSMPVASMSKLITAMAAMFSIPATTTIEITEAETRYPADSSNLSAGEKFEMRELLYPMLLNSSNVAAEALASSTDRDKFLELMSGYAWEIGMPKSFFADPSGLSPRNVASARDILALAEYLYRFHPDILRLTKTDSLEVSTTTDHGAHKFTSIHPFVNDRRFIGGKTGRTNEAGETMLTILDIDDKPIAFIILGSDMGARENDTRILLRKYLDTL